MKTQVIKKSMNTKTLVLNSILLALGLLMHQITPALGLPIQPDLALSMLFIIIILNKDDYKACIASAIITGIFTALTTKFPGGQIPNILDKIITANIIFGSLYMINKMKIKGGIKNKYVIILIFSVGTLISGSIFLTTASLIVGLPGEFTSLFMISVIPATLANAIVGVLLLNIIDRIINIK